MPLSAKVEAQAQKAESDVHRATIEAPRPPPFQLIN